MRLTAPLLILSLALLMTAPACRTYTGLEVDSFLEQALTAAEQRKAEGETFEANLIAKHIYQIDPDYPGYAASFGTAPPEVDDRFNRPWMGANETMREPTGAGVLTRVLWYIPDRVLDLTDIISFDLHIGLGLYADVHATRAVGFGLGARTVAGVGWHFNRSLGIQTQSQAAALAPLVGFEGYSAFKTGTSGARGGSWSVPGIQWPSEDLYRDYRDYWATGFAVTAGFVGVDADLHLAQVMDLLAGVIFLDPANDDFGRTTGLGLERHEQLLLSDLAQIAGNRASIEAYQAWKAAQGGSGDADTEAPAAGADDTPDDDGDAGTDGAAADDSGDADGQG